MENRYGCCKKGCKAILHLERHADNSVIIESIKLTIGHNCQKETHKSLDAQKFHQAIIKKAESEKRRVNHQLFGDAKNE